MNLGLKGRVYAITGASSGLGYATAETLVAEGARVVLGARDPKKLTTACGNLGGPQVATACAVNNADPDTPQQLIDSAHREFGRLDGVMVSVGGPPSGSVQETTDEQWREAFESIFLGAVRIARVIGATLPNGGSIAFVLSSTVRMPIPYLAISNGLRPGLAMIARSLSAEFGPHGVRVNSLLPGRIQTNRLLQMNAARDLDDIHEDVASVDLRRDGDPIEFARVAAFVLSPAASFMTGALIPVDGGTIPCL
ncbi:oxidoreductase [Streptomyces viridochromogenes]|uniref:Oxidoreductase n=1 Tax=Streptomyces viridochromogenes TaxID=1938 RepID=A0A0J8C6T2_STRVR|nr:SDR family oxidoreductase [Streptomyces viridochromogenes]KMS73590.1 oxidoreductase [Streptomyces viridochromogenes]KOG07904.1 oxidoreductase [Streptomyces viridochromogenes]KOG28338.1 oxidoreductase [Streptomyces viridochromogenes]